MSSAAFPQLSWVSRNTVVPAHGIMIISMSDGENKIHEGPALLSVPSLLLHWKSG